MPEQLAFPLPRLEARGRDAFFVASANALAVRQIEGWRDWPDRKLVLTGPEGSGKTHLAHVWAAMAGARVVPATSIAAAAVPDLAGAPLAVEDADRVPRTAQAEAVLFHLHNLALANGQPLLFTARAAPRDWSLKLPDLASRIEATATATLEAPDDALLAAVMVKLFADRQISPPPRLIEYCVRRMDRSFAAARRLV
ncbi:MAG: chromosomal replication initiator DnaA, partial [Rhodobacteraceae bacterium]|nr:chromosomal replication initiator DnaA [Paracoccaceae bacterium]